MEGIVVNIPYARLTDRVFLFTKLAVQHLKSPVTIYEKDRMIAVVHEPNGRYQLKNKQETHVISSVYLASYLVKKFNRQGLFFAENRTFADLPEKALLISEEPIDAVPLNIEDFRPIDFLPMSRYCSVIVKPYHVRLNWPGSIPYFGNVAVLRRGDIFAILPDPNSRLNLAPFANNNGIIFSKALSSRVGRVSTRFSWFWHEGNILFFTANGPLYRSVRSVAGFVPVLSSEQNIRSKSMLTLSMSRGFTGVPQKDARSIDKNYLSLYESGRFMALAPAPNGPYQICFHQNKSGYFCQIRLQRIILEKFNGVRTFHSRGINGRLYFSPDQFDKVPAWRSFRLIPDPSIVGKILLYYTPEKKLLHLPTARRKLPFQVAFYRYKDLWAIVGEENGPYRIWKHKGVIHCAGLIPLIQRTCGCGDEANLFSTFRDGVLYFGNRRLDRETLDFTKFKRVE